MKEKYINSLDFKNTVLTKTPREIKEHYDETFEKPFEEFIKRYEATKELDPDFFLVFKELTVLIREVLWSYKYNPTTVDFDDKKCDKVLSDMTLVELYLEKDRKNKKDNYKTREENDRSITIIDSSTLKEIIAKDYEIYEDINSNKVKEKTLTDKNDDIEYREFFHMSINKFLNCCPELFDNKKFRQNTTKLYFNYYPEKKKGRTLTKQFQTITTQRTI